MRNRYLIYIILILLLVIVLTGFKVFSGSGQIEKLIKEANSLYRQGEYGKAGKIYEEGLSKDVEYPKLNYNLANVRYQTDRYQAALKLYQKGTDSANKYLLLGNIPYELAENAQNPGQKIMKYQQALESYKDGIIKYPRDVKLKYNYEFVKKKLEDIQNQDQKSNQQNNNQQKNEEEINNNKGNQDRQGQKNNNQGDQPNDNRASAQNQKQNGQNGLRDQQVQQIMKTLKVLEEEEKGNLKNNQELHQNTEEEEYDW